MKLFEEMSEVELKRELNDRLKENADCVNVIEVNKRSLESNKADIKELSNILNKRLDK